MKPPSGGRRPANQRGSLPSFSTGPRRPRKAAGTASGAWRRKRNRSREKRIHGFVVTSLTSERWAAQALYEELYCARGDMENPIKERYSLFADRVSTETMRGNQMRLYLSAMAYILVSGLRRLGLKANELAEAQVIDDPYEAAEDRRPDPGDGAQGLGLDGFQLSVAAAISAGVGEPAPLKWDFSISSNTFSRSPRQRPCGAVLAIGLR
jgi:hypothetical protein